MREYWMMKNIIHRLESNSYKVGPMLKRCKSLKNKFYTGILPAVVGVATAGMFFSFSHFLPAIKNTSARILLETSTVALYTMCFISYYYAITIKNDVPPTLLMPRIKSQLANNHPAYTEKKKCDK